MADTTAPTWLQALQIPTLGQSVLVIVTAAATILSTLTVQWLAAPRMDIPAADKPAPIALQKQIDSAVNRLDGRITEAIGKADLCVDMLTAHAKDWRTPRAAPRAAVVK